MNIDIPTKKTEALRRMRSLGIADCIISDFQNNDNVQICETRMGIGYWPNEKIKEVIKNFEERFSALVYGGTKTTFVDGDVHYTLLYVSDYEEEWESDRNDIEYGTLLAYVYNETCPEFSEIGSVSMTVNKASGGLVRRL